MITKERKVKKYGCFYASDFHLEMILLPYIKNNLHKSDILIYTQNNLNDSIKLVLSRTNLSEEEKNKILNLNWNNKELNLYDTVDNQIIIINGNKKYIDEINNKILNLDVKNITVINCYDINIIEENKIDITKDYEGILNTNYITK